MKFEQAFQEWMQEEIEAETNKRRKERLEKGLSFSSMSFLREGWYPAVGHFTHLHPEWEYRDYRNRLRYLDFAYLPPGDRGAVEIQDFRTHARDLDIGRFIDLNWRHSCLSMDNWTILTIPFPSVGEEPKHCQHMILSFIGKFLATDVPKDFTWLECEAVRFARRLVRPFTPSELASHLHVSPRHARTILHSLTAGKHLVPTGDGEKRIRYYQLDGS